MDTRHGVLEIGHFRIKFSKIVKNNIDSPLITCYHNINSKEMTYIKIK